MLVSLVHLHGGAHGRIRDKCDEYLTRGNLGEVGVNEDADLLVAKSFKTGHIKEAFPEFFVDLLSLCLVRTCHKTYFTICERSITRAIMT